MNFIGREKELNKIEKKINSSFKEIVVFYGRRRVGKTETCNFLINKYKEEHFILHFTGRYKETKKNIINSLKENLILQLKNSDFLKSYSFIVPDFLEDKIQKISSVMDFFFCLREIYLLLDDFFDFKKKNIKYIIFFDEISYLDKYSGFWKEFSSQWNEFFCKYNNVKFLLTGSVVYWIRRNVSENTEDFYNRITEEIELHPFSLNETKEFFYKNFHFFNDDEIFLYHMIFGGVPYYYSLIDPKIDFKSNISKLFKKNGRLYNEYKMLCEGLFSEKRNHKDILEILASSKNKAYSIDDISSILNKDKKIHDDLNELEECNFIKKNYNFKNNKHDCIYSISDPFVYFYLNYLAKNNFEINDKNFQICCGFLFELFCFNNKDLICEKLGLKGISNKILPFYFRNEKSQIDLLLKRPDETIVLIECKFYNKVFTINDETIKDIQNKKQELLTNDVFEKNNKNIQIVIATYKGSKISSNNILLDALNYDLISFN